MKKVKIGITFFLILLDIILLPYLITFPFFIKEYGSQAPTIWLSEFSIMFGIDSLFTDPKLRNLWFAVQPLVFLFILLLWWQFGLKRDNKIKGLGGPKAAGQGEFGTSQWQTRKEIEAAMKVYKINKSKIVSKKKDPIKKGGFVLGYDKGENKVFIDDTDSHLLNVGTSRSGKTRTFILPTIWELGQSGESMVITDPKGELYSLTSRYLEKKGYEVVMLDFRNPMRGNKWNPMYLVNKAVEEEDYSTASELAWDLAHTIVHQKPRSGDPLWANGAESVVASLILVVAIEAENESEKHLTSVFQMLSELGGTIQTEDGPVCPLADYFERLPRGHLAKVAFTTAALAAYKQRASFFMDVAAELRLFSDPGVSYLTSKQDHVLGNIGMNKTVVFLIIPDEKTTRHVLASMYIDQCYQELVKVANNHNDRLPNRVNFLIDEFGNMPPIKDFENKLTVCLGRGMRFALVVQSLGQLKVKYREVASIIKDNCHTWLYLLTTSIETAKEVSEKTGTYTIETTNLSTSFQTRNNESRGISSSVSKRSLLTPDEILRWQYGNALLLRARENPSHLPLPDITEWPAHEEFIPIERGEIKKKIDHVPIWIPIMDEEVTMTEEDENLKGTSSIVSQLDTPIDKSKQETTEITQQESTEIAISNQETNHEIPQLQQESTQNENEQLVPESKQESKEESTDINETENFLIEDIDLEEELSDFTEDIETDSEDLFDFEKDEVAASIEKVEELDDQKSFSLKDIK